MFSPQDKAVDPLRVVVIEPVPYRNSNTSKLERRQPAFLLLAGIQVYGADGRPAAISNPQWDHRKLHQRVTTTELINQLR